MDRRTLRKHQSHDNIIDAASRLLRAQGPDGMSVDALMARAGLTRGAFYAHFADKNALVAAALEHAFEAQIATLFRAGKGTRGRAKLEALAARYLTLAHVEATEDGCPAPALASDIARGSGALKRVFRKHVTRLVDELARETDVERHRAMAIVATWFGALVLARAVGDAHAAEEFLAAAHRHTVEPPARVTSRGRKPARRAPFRRRAGSPRP